MQQPMVVVDDPPHEVVGGACQDGTIDILNEIDRDGAGANVGINDVVTRQVAGRHGDARCLDAHISTSDQPPEERCLTLCLGLPIASVDTQIRPLVDS